MPRKVHLRLRFQNLGKPRTAGLCGRAAGACDCGPLSCTKIERPSPPRKPSCKVRLFAQNRSRIYRQKVTVTTLSPTTSHPDFQLLAQMAHVRFHGRKWVHNSAFGEGSHTAAYTSKQGAFPSANTARLCAASEIATERTTGENGCTPMACVRFLRRRGPTGLRCPNCQSVHTVYLSLQIVRDSLPICRILARFT